MEKLISYFVKYPFWSNVLIAATIIGGGYFLLTTKRSYFPERKVKDIYIEVYYPGASPEEVEETITDKIEDNLRGIVGVDEILSTSNENNAKIQVIATNRADVDELLTDVKNAVDQINSFPAGAEKPKVYKAKPLDRVMFLTLSGTDDLIKTKDIAERIYDDLLATGFISQVTISGVADPEISIEVPENVLEQYNVSLSDIQAQVLAFNRDLTIGSIKGDQQEYFLRFRNKSVEINDIKNIPVLTQSGKEIRLGDIARVAYQLPPDQTSAIFDGNPCANINVSKNPDEDILQIADYLKEYQEEFNLKNDVYKLSISYDASEAVRGRITILQNNGLTGLILVLVVLGIFLNFRLSFWVAFGIPMSFLGMFIVTQGTGLTINQISLFGMILVSGILVDDGIVISENIFTKLQMGMSPRMAAIKGTMEMLPSVFTSVMTTIVVFCGFFFIEGGIGEIIPEMGIVVIGCLVFSMVEATLLLPVHLNNKKINDEPGKLRKAFNKVIDKVRFEWYGSYLKLALDWKWISLTVGICLTMMGLAMFKSDKIGKSFFPPFDSDLVNVEVAFYPGQSAKVTEKYLEDINKDIKVISDSLEKTVGTPIVSTRYYVGSNSLEVGNQAGTVEVRLKKSEERNMTNEELSKLLRNKLQLDKKAPQSAVGGRDNFGKPISYKLVSKNKKQLESAKEEFKAKLALVTQVTDVTDNSASVSKEIVFELTNKAINLGFSPNDIVNQLRSRFFGNEIQKLQKRAKEVRVWVRLNEEEREKLFSLNEVKIKKGTLLIPLKELATWSYSSSSNSIKHYNGMKEISIEASNANPDKPIAPVITEIEEQIVPDILSKYGDVKFEHSGQAKTQEKLMKSALPVVVICIILIYFIIGLTFRSWLQPLLIIAMIFPAVMGAFIGHYIESTFLVIMSYLGSIALIGIVVNDAVVFMDKVNANLKSEMKIKEALVNAGQSRFRAIILTSITTMAGLYPLIFEGSTQAKFLIPMAITITYGVFFATLSILLFFPILVACANDIRRIKYWIWNGEWVEGHLLEPAYKEKKRLEDEAIEDE
jgi:multidrug efflux pump subunit AcrB